MDGRLVITVRRGKTLGVTPPYVLALHNGPLAADLLASSPDATTIDSSCGHRTTLQHNERRSSNKRVAPSAGDLALVQAFPVEGQVRASALLGEPTVALD
jgi:hypothetical protein